MVISAQTKEDLKRQVVACLAGQPEIRRIVIFGSFLDSSDPADMDIAVFQDSDEKYYPLALTYRRLLEPVAERLPIDVLPLRPNPGQGPFLREIEAGEVLYER